jgi:hypothetical protein
MDWQQCPTIMPQQRRTAACPRTFQTALVYVYLQMKAGTCSVRNVISTLAGVTRMNSWLRIPDLAHCSTACINFSLWTKGCGHSVCFSWFVTPSVILSSLCFDQGQNLISYGRVTVIWQKRWPNLLHRSNILWRSLGSGFAGSLVQSTLRTHPYGRPGVRVCWHLRTRESEGGLWRCGISD